MLTSRSILKMLPAVGLLALAAHSQAAVLTASAPVSFTAPGNVTTSSSITAAIPKFDPTLGTLTSATIELIIPNLTEYLSVKAGSNFVNGVFVPGYNLPYSFTPVAMEIGLTNPSATDLTVLGTVSFGAPAIFVAGTLPTTPYVGTTPSDSSVILLDTYTMPTLDSTFAVTAAELTQLTGAGTVGARYRVATYAILPLISGVSTPLGLGSYSGTANVTYNYDAVPEPASLSLLAIGAPLLFRRRRAH